MKTIFILMIVVPPVIMATIVFYQIWDWKRSRQAKVIRFDAELNEKLDDEFITNNLR